MMDMFFFNIFPEGSLASSIITTVWVGVCVVVFFNLRFGWVLSGLVVPGYLVPLLLLKPWGAVAIMVEALATYGVVWFFTVFLSRYGVWFTPFGRDRFFLLLLVSIAIRLLFDTTVFPFAGEWVNNHYHIQFDYYDNLHSFGLIIIALIANQFWKTGLVRGLPPFIVMVATTYFIVDVILLNYTNFSLGNLSYLYEEVASSIEASPKSYIILMTTAWIASRMNLRYGWDFNGILIPSLLALQWHEPEKILSTFVETFVILGLASVVLMIPWFAQRNIERGRKILFFFHISFAYKMILGFMVLHFWPEIKVTDTYGFGYLLATLVAIKMHDLGIVTRMTRATLQTSLVAIFLSSVVGFSLTLLPALWWESPEKQRLEIQERPYIKRGFLVDVLRQDKVELYAASTKKNMKVASERELELFRQAMMKLHQYVKSVDSEDLQQAQQLLRNIGYELSLLEGRYLYLKNQHTDHSWGIYVLDMQAKTSLLIEVPAAMDERGSMEAGRLFFQLMGASGLAMSGSQRHRNQDGSADVLKQRHSPFQLFHREFSQNNVLQVRSYTRDSRRVMSHIKATQGGMNHTVLASSLWVKHSLPVDLNMVRLKALVHPFTTVWSVSPTKNRLREASHQGFAELFLNEQDIRRILPRSLAASPLLLNIYDQRIDGYLQDWLLSNKHRIAVRGSHAYQPAKDEELLFFDEEVVAPMLRAARLQYRQGEWLAAGLLDLRAATGAASILGYEIVRYRHRHTGTDYLILREQEHPPFKRFWGTFVFRLGQAEPYMLQVPRPLFEMNSFEYSVTLFERLNARALLIGGAHPKANLDGSSDLIQLRNKANLFNLINQVVVRDMKDQPLTIIHSRAFGYRDDAPVPDADALITFSDGSTTPQTTSLQAKRLLKIMKKDGLKIKFVDGSKDTAGYEVGNVPQSLYLRQSLNKEFMILWLSPQARSGYRQQTDNRLQQAQFDALHIPSVRMHILDYIRQQGYQASDQLQLSDALRTYLKHYMERQDMVSLYGVWRESQRYQLTRVLDPSSRQSFLVIRLNQKVGVITNLMPMHIQRQIHVIGEHTLEDVLRGFVETRSAWLYFGSAP